MDNAVGAVNRQLAIVGNLLRDRNEKARKLRRRLRGTIAILTQFVDPMDPLWEAYGLNRPGQKERPEPPAKPVIIEATANAAVVKWEPPARAAYYHAWIRVKGAAEWVRVGAPVDPDFTFRNLPPDTEVELAISALNNGGESPLGELVVWLVSSPHPV